VLAGLSLPLLIACSPTKAIVKTEIVKQYPPAAWTQDCPIPPYIPGQDWQYVGEYARALQVELKQCNCDKTKLRAWAADETPPECKAK
jgi:hypothetical protein